MADNAPDWEIDQRDYRALVLVIYQWLLDVRDRLRLKLKGKP